MNQYFEPFYNALAMGRDTANLKYQVGQQNALMGLRQQEEQRQREAFEAQQQAAQYEQAMTQQAGNALANLNINDPQAMQAYAAQYGQYGKPYLDQMNAIRPQYAIQEGQYIPKDPGYGQPAAPIPGYQQQGPQLNGDAANLAALLGRNPTPEEYYKYKNNLAASGASRTTINNNLSKGQEKADTAYAEQYVGDVTGGLADNLKQIDQLAGVAEALRTQKNLTGTVIGNMPESILTATYPSAVEARDSVAEVVQRSLREILGAQFTEKEGAMLINRAYNMRLPQEVNAKRVDRLVRQLKVAADAKASAAQYFEKNGTIKGWRGKVYTMADFIDDRVPTRSPGQKTETTTPEQGGIQFLGFE